MRITDSMRMDAMMRAQSAASERMARASRVASSGLRVEMPSDDPVAYAAVVAHDARLAVLDGRSTNATRAAGDLDVADSALSSATDLLLHAKDIALQAANGSVDAATRASLAVDIKGVFAQLVAVGNTRGASGYLFGGTNTNLAPFDASGNFLGNANTTSLEIADGVQVQSNASGARAFTIAGGQDVFATLGNLANALATNNVAGIQASLSQLDGAGRQIVAAQTDAGTAGERLRSAAEVIAGATLREKTARASEAEADAPTAFTELAAAQSAYERSVEVTKRILSINGLASF